MGGFGRKIVGLGNFENDLALGFWKAGAVDLVGFGIVLVGGRLRWGWLFGVERRDLMASGGLRVGCLCGLFEVVLVFLLGRLVLGRDRMAQILGIPGFLCGV